MNTNTLHHLATGLAFGFLIGWYFLFKTLGFIEWTTAQMPEGYEGSGLMLAIGTVMAPAFYIWSRFNRFVEKKLNIKGIYYEDSYYQKDLRPDNTNKKKDRD
ncbi:hypothetical protein [Neptunomonas antarctica]|uniref:Solute:sodium symporter small subunit n=1 Tax=Neptunomonas antarctica TaxID=619304 RepID=A0A1N7LR88_9GAMM|nr:hypothetical protein [Neptunomonas antarctica]SIS76279.1 hypothetical protein SAMN05421760_104261 [Neptunomonas antarctica]